MPQAGSQSTQPNSSIPAFGTIDGFAVQAGQTATGSVSQPLLQSTQSAQHVALQEPSSEGEASPLVMQLLTHHRRQQSGQQQASNISPSGGLLPTDYHRSLNTFLLTGSAQPASVTTPTKKARPNFHFGLSPLSVPPEALKQPQETAQTVIFIIILDDPKSSPTHCDQTPDEFFVKDDVGCQVKYYTGVGTAERRTR
ncbi:hypothetical protein NCS52_01485800 [Fusarium sp. LHS14.1]|nr:hypothetical protein NCS52_01485800 [Fusarium sp. LHS14.1]